MSHHNYNNHGRSSRPSHPGGDSHSGSFLEQGRTILPPLTIAFPTSDSPGSFFNVTSTHVNSTLASLDTVSGNYPSQYPTQQRSTPVPYGQPYCACFDRRWTSLTVLTLHAKTHLPSSNPKLGTLRVVIIRTSSFPTRDTLALRRTALTIEGRPPLARLTLGSSGL